MSIISPTTCGFAKIGAYIIFSKETLPKIRYENLVTHRSREIKHQFHLWNKQFDGFNEQFNIRYDSFRKYGDKIGDVLIRNISSKYFVKKSGRSYRMRRKVSISYLIVMVA